MNPVPLFVELCAGTAALSLRLARPGLRPPATRMGSKGSYADPILGVLGLEPGQGAVHHLWCEPDVQARVGLELLRDRTLALEAAKVIRGWQDPPGGYRKLWDDLRARGDFTCPPDSIEAARYLTLRAWQLHGDDLLKNTGYRGPDCTATGRLGVGQPGTLAQRLEALPELDATVLEEAVTPEEAARYLTIRAWKLYGDLLTNGGYRGPDIPSHSTLGVGQPDIIAKRLEGLPELDATVLEGAVTPEEAARYLALRAWTLYGDPLKGGGYQGPDWAPPKYKHTRSGVGQPDALAQRLEGLPELDATVLEGAVTPEEAARYITLRAWTLHGGLLKGGGYQGPDWTARLGRDKPNALAQRLEALPELDATVLEWAVIPPLTLPPGTVCYMDPPYVNTTGYAHDLPRSKVIELARAWAEAGATVCISEAEAIPELVAEGWHAVEITGSGSGATRTLSKQKREFLTLNREPNPYWAGKCAAKAEQYLARAKASQGPDALDMFS